MRLPSVNKVVEDIQDTLIRFPVVILDAFVGTIAAIIAINSEKAGEGHDEAIQICIKILLTTLVGLPLFLALGLWSERKNYTLSLKTILNVLLIFLLIGYYFWLPSRNLEHHVPHLTRFFLFLLIGHLLVSFAAFTQKGEINGFWEFNKTVFLRICLSVLYSGFIYLGLVIALLGMDKLLDLKVEGETYFKLFCVIAGIFNTIFFLAGIPKNLEALEAEMDFPQGLKTFVQFVLLPLITVYLIILCLYDVKILANWSLPKGWVSYLIVVFSVMGIFSLLLIYPIQNKEENKWIRSFNKYFYIILLPQIAVLFIAIFRRFKDYGVTELRYFLVLISFWLLGISLYFLISKKKNIKLIPISLCILTILSAFGPWGAFAVAERSQINRFETILTKNQMLQNGKVIEKDKIHIASKDAEDMRSILDFLAKRNSLGALQPYFTENIDSLLKNVQAERYSNYYIASSNIKERFNLEYNTTDPGDKAVQFYSLKARQQEEKNIEGYDLLVFLERDYTKENRNTYKKLFTYKSSNKNCSFQLKNNEILIEKNEQVVFKYHLESFIKEKIKNNPEQTYIPLTEKEMTIESKQQKCHINLVFNEINFTKEKEKITLSDIEGYILIKFLE